MSGAGENRYATDPVRRSIGWISNSSRSSWQQRPQGRGNRTSGPNTPNKDGGRQQAMAALSGNAWKSKGAGGGDRAQAQPPSVQQEAHVPVKDFNAGEVREFLKKSTRTPFLDGSRWRHSTQ